MKYIAKKEYTTPIIETYKIKMQHMIATSVNPEDGIEVVEGEHHGGFGARDDDWDED